LSGNVIRRSKFLVSFAHAASGNLAAGISLASTGLRLKLTDAIEAPPQQGLQRLD
jgi:hypothetical protein